MAATRACYPSQETTLSAAIELEKPCKTLKKRILQIFAPIPESSIKELSSLVQKLISERLSSDEIYYNVSQYLRAKLPNFNLIYPHNTVLRID